jgi:predicted dehydrogenase
MHSTAVLGSGLVLTSRAMSQTNDLNIGVIGLGTQGQKLIAACMKIPGIKITALCDIWETFNLKRASRILTRYQQEHKTYTTYQDMLAQEKDLDGVIIATPDAFHAEQTNACLNAGINVYCESMMAHTIEGAKSMLQTAKQTGKLLQIGYQRRSNPYYIYAFNNIINQTKMIGDITAMNAQWNRPKQPSRGWPRRTPVDEATLQKYGFESMDQFRNWTWYRKFGNGPLGELGSHQIDVNNWYMEKWPASVMASAGVAYYEDNSHECYDTVMAVYEYPNGQNRIRSFYQTINMNSNFGYYENFMGDVGTLYVSESVGRVKVYREPEAPDWSKWVQLGILSEVKKDQPKKEEETTASVLDVQETVLPPEYNLPVQFNESVFQPHLENFFESIRGNTRLTCPPEIAYPSTVCVLKINESVEKGQKIEFSESDFQV